MCAAMQQVTVIQLEITYNTYIHTEAKKETITHIHTYKHAHTHTHVHTHEHIHTHACTHLALDQLFSNLDGCFTEGSTVLCTHFCANREEWRVVRVRLGGGGGREWWTVKQSSKKVGRRGKRNEMKGK